MIPAPLLLLIIGAHLPKKDTSKPYCTSDTNTVKKQLLEDFNYDDVVYTSGYGPGDVVVAFCDGGADGHRLKCEGSGWKHENGSTNVGCPVPTTQGSKKETRVL